MLQRRSGSGDTKKYSGFVLDGPRPKRDALGGGTGALQLIIPTPTSNVDGLPPRPSTWLSAICFSASFCSSAGNLSHRRIVPLVSPDSHCWNQGRPTRALNRPARYYKANLSLRRPPQNHLTEFSLALRRCSWTCRTYRLREPHIHLQASPRPPSSTLLFFSPFRSAPLPPLDLFSPGFSNACVAPPSPPLLCSFPRSADQEQPTL